MRSTLLALALGAPLFAAITPPPVGGSGPPALTIPHTFQSGTPALAAEVNDNFDAAATAGTDLRSAFDALEHPTAPAALVVAPRGGDHASIADALADAGALASQSGERVVVRVVPGTYDEPGALAVPPDVTLRGDVAHGTRIRVSAQYALTLGDRSRLESVTLQHTGGPGEHYCVWAEGEEVRLEDVRVLPPLATVSGFHAFRSESGDLTLRDCRYDSDGAPGRHYGVASWTNGAVVVERSSFRVTEWALIAIGDAKLRSCVLSSERVAITAIFATTVSITDCEVAGAVRALEGQHAGATYRVADSLIDGEIHDHPIVRLVHCHDGAYDPLTDR